MDRSLRLRDEWAINDVRRRGRSFSSGPLLVKVLASADRSTTNQYAVIAGKRAGGAVERNRCKRLIREALRGLHPQLEQGYAVTVTVRGGPDQLASRDAALNHLIRIFTNARLLDAVPAVTTGSPSAPAS